MAWTTHALIGFTLSFGFAVAATACDDGGGDGSTSGGSTNTSTSTSTTGGGAVTNPIPFNMGWADLAGNTYGIQGAFYTFNDNEDADANGIMGASVIMPADFAAAGTEIDDPDCAKISFPEFFSVLEEAGL